MTSKDGSKWEKDHASWGIDIFSLMPNVVFCFDSDSLRIYNYRKGNVRTTTLAMLESNYVDEQNHAAFRSGRIIQRDLG